jgi:probable rRNA maturation factor
MIEVQVRAAFKTLGLADLARDTALKALDHEHQVGQIDLTIVLSDDKEVRRLNHQFMGIDAPTDVLSFPSEEVDPASGAHYLGDIIISLPRATDQANQGNHPLEAELQLLIVHGVLHLLGYDHGEPMEKAKMWAAQAEILKELGSPLQFPAE